MRIAIMQPYFLPYIGYFQLLGAVDEFIIYDNIKYTKKGWINRNRMLRNGMDVTFSVPLRKDSDALDIRGREVAADFDRAKLLNQLREAYRRAPMFDVAFPVVEKVISNPQRNLFEFLRASIVDVCEYLGLNTPIRISSTVDIDWELKAQDKVLAICSALGATRYLNPIGGQELYSREAFASRGIELSFIKSRPFEYRQLGAPFVPSLSIVDVMMFNPIGSISDFLKTGYDLV